MALSTFTSDPFFSGIGSMPGMGAIGSTWDPFETMTTTPTGRKRTYRTLDNLGEGDNPPGINMDFLEKDNRYLVKCDMPGYNKKDINMTVDNNILHIHATKKELPCEAKAHYFRRERTFGRIDRMVRLPVDCDTAGKADVEYLNGVVTISFPKVAGSSSKSKKLQIK